jgi:hypothetical protein
MTALDSSSLKFWESLAEWGTKLVIVGVVGEALELVLKWIEYKWKSEAFRNWCEKQKFSLDVFWPGVFWIMVVGGLIMEFRGSHEAQLIVQTENNRIMKESAEAIKEAADAKWQAALANERAAEANLKASSNELARIEMEKQIKAVNGDVKKLNPLEEPLYKISGIATLSVSNVPPDFFEKAVTFMGFQSEGNGLSLISVGARCIGITHSEHFGSNTVGSFSFSFSQVSSAEDALYAESAKKIADAAHGLWFKSQSTTTNFSPTCVMDGFVTIKFNDRIIKHFVLPPGKLNRLNMPSDQPEMWDLTIVTDSRTNTPASLIDIAPKK